MTLNLIRERKAGVTPPRALRKERLIWLLYPFQRQACRQSSVNLGDLPPGTSWPAEPAVQPGDGSGACGPFVPPGYHDEATTRERLDSPAPGHGLIRSTRVLRYSAGYWREKERGSATLLAPNPPPWHGVVDR